MIAPIQTPAFGAPGIDPRWTNGAKEGVGTAYAASCRVWFTLWNGVLTEVYYPTIDLPQIRDLQLLFTDGQTFFDEEKRDFTKHIERLEPSLAYRLINTHRDGHYRVVKTIITDPHLACVLMNVRVEGEPEFLDKLQIYTLCAPHLNGGGMGNNALVREVAGKTLLCAHKSGGGLTDAQTYMTLGADVPFGKTSVGYVGESDGWSDLHADFNLNWNFKSAPDGNVALTGEILAPLENGVQRIHSDSGVWFGPTFRRHHDIAIVINAVCRSSQPFHHAVATPAAPFARFAASKRRRRKTSAHLI
jgi:glucoamylase